MEKQHFLSLKTKHDISEKENEKLKKKLEQIIDQNDAMKLSEGRLENQIKQMVVNFSQSQELLTSKDQEISQLKNELDNTGALEIEIKELKMKVRESTQKISKLKENISYG